MSCNELYIIINLKSFPFYRATRLRENFTVGGYIFFLNCEQARRFNILMYSSIPAEIVKPMSIKAYDDLDKLMADADEEESKCPS